MSTQSAEMVEFIRRWRSWNTPTWSIRLNGLS